MDESPILHSPFPHPPINEYRPSVVSDDVANWYNKWFCFTSVIRKDLHKDDATHSAVMNLFETRHMLARSWQDRKFYK